MRRACDTLKRLPEQEERVRLAAERIEGALLRESLMREASDFKDRCGVAP